MVALKEIAIYIILAIVVVAVVVFVLSSGLFKSSYDIRVTLSQENTGILYPYQTSHYTINITNRGHRTVSNLLIGYYLDGIEQNTTTVSIPPGQSVVMVKNYTYPTAGPYTFEASADPGHILDIVNRNYSQSSVTTNVTPATLPDVYTSIPNTNITGTQSFTVDEGGVIGSAAIAQRYNISLINKLFLPAEGISTKIFENSYPFTANVYGAYAAYSDNTVAYTAWFQGTVTPQIISTIISSFGPKVRTISGNQGLMSYAPINGTTSMCTFYSGGWTKIIAYYNASMPSTCVNIASDTYSSYESALLTGLIKENTNLTHYQSGFFYTNSSILGSALTYSMLNLTATNIFENNYGIFISSIKRLAYSINVSSFNDSTCYGLIYSSNGIGVCSYIIPTRTGNYSLPYGLVNSSYVTGNYILNIYSLVNNTQLVAAHGNAANLMSRLGVNESSVMWNTVYQNTCAFDNQSIGCTYKGFSKPNTTAYFNITNNLPGSMIVNQLNCEISGGFKNVSVNATIAPNSSREFTQLCNTIPLSSTALQTSYMLILNYTYNNVTTILNGTLNVTNQAST